MAFRTYFEALFAVLACAVLLVACADRRRDTRTGSDGGRGGDGGTLVEMDGGGLPGTDGGPARADGGTPGVDGGRPGVDGAMMGTDGGPPPPRDAGRDGGPPPPRDAGPPMITIGMIQRGMVPVSTIVTVRNVVVTAVSSGGVWVQDPAGGPTYSGIRVYLGGAPTVAINDRVDVMGTYIEYFGDSEIDSATLTRLGTGTAIVPVSVTAAMAGTEPYEGVLVRVSGAVTNTAYSCAVDDSGCTDASLWEIGGVSGVVAYNFVYSSADWVSHIGTTPVTGVMSWRYDRRRVMPRTSTDF